MHVHVFVIAILFFFVHSAPTASYSCLRRCRLSLRDGQEWDEYIEICQRNLSWVEEEKEDTYLSCRLHPCHHHENLHPDVAVTVEERALLHHKP